ncbi:MAG: OmpA family protein [Saprospiraceae bacterium]|nr:OmpA family protein [Saprospiraceae bacterium]
MFSFSKRINVENRFLDFVSKTKTHRQIWSFILVFILIFLSNFQQLSGQQKKLDVKSFDKIVLNNETQINTRGLETFPQWIGDTLAFVAGIDAGKDYQIVIASGKKDDKWSGYTELGKHINSNYFEGPFSYDTVHNILYFTRVDYDKKRIQRANAKKQDSIIINLSIWQSALAKGSKAEKINIRGEEYSVTDPAISPDGEYLVFTSDRPDGFGGRDLYIARRDKNEWVGISNLGKGINSSKNEGYANFANEQTLVFASDREGGHGGFDVYYVTVENQIWSEPKLLPKPINSPYDDIHFIIAGNGKEGYLASNRPGGKGEDDIYRWSAPQSVWVEPSAEPVISKDFNEEVDIEVWVFEKLTLLAFPDATVRFTEIEMFKEDVHLDDPTLDIVDIDDTGNMYLKWNTIMKDVSFTELKSNDKGNANIRLKKNVYYKVESLCDVCETEIVFFKPSLHGKVLNITLQPSDEEETVETDDPEMTDVEAETLLGDTQAGSVYVLENLYYDYDSDKIILSEKNDLDILATKMKENPNLRILLESHTDSRGSDAYNVILSKKRATNAKEYLVSKGVNPKKILTKGLGESRLRNHCKNGVPCGDEDHRYNRRTEVIILPE